jgi:SNF2 family DNA or RNA helicase
VNPSRNVDEENAIFLLPELARVVKPHQVESIQFMWENVVNGQASSGCLLALEMGLGKTLCSIAFIHSFVSQNIGKRVIVLCPNMVIQNWVSEFNKWLPKPHQPKIWRLTAEIPEMERLDYIKTWVNCKESKGAVMLIGLGPLFSSLILGKKKTGKKAKKAEEATEEPEAPEDEMLEKYREYLLNPGLWFFSIFLTFRFGDC